MESSPAGFVSGAKLKVTGGGAFTASEVSPLGADAVDPELGLGANFDSAKTPSRLAKSENVPPTADFYPKLPPYLEIISQ